MQEVLNHISDSSSNLTGKRRKKFSAYSLWQLLYRRNLRQHSEMTYIQWSGALNSTQTKPNMMYRVGQKVGHILMTTVLSNLNQFNKISHWKIPR